MADILSAASGIERAARSASGLLSSTLFQVANLAALGAIALVVTLSDPSAADARYWCNNPDEAPAEFLSSQECSSDHSGNLSPSEPSESEGPTDEPQSDRLDTGGPSDPTSADPSNTSGPTDDQTTDHGKTDAPSDPPATDLGKTDAPSDPPATDPSNTGTPSDAPTTDPSDPDGPTDDHDTDEPERETPTGFPTTGA